MTFNAFNILHDKDARKFLLSCCGSSHWVDQVMLAFPFSSIEELIMKTVEIWYHECSERDYLEAFSHHPMIGDLDNLKKKFATNKQWTSEEQLGVSNASDVILKGLISFNREYLDKYGFIFLICATGKSAGEMLALGKARLAHKIKEELQLTANEQHKITLIRLVKLIPEIKSSMKKSQITTHVLNTSKGIPGKGITVRLQKKNNNEWETLSVGLTDEDGRVSDLLPSGRKLEPGPYQLVFETGNYFNADQLETFFPEVCIQFFVGSDDHYHVPLLISPFTYSTYRGS